MTATPATASIDMRGKKITTFILYHAVIKLREMGEGDVLQMETEAFEGIESDIRAWCRMTGNKLVEVEKEADRETYRIEKGRPEEEGRQLALVVSDPGLEELLSPLAFGLAAALEGTRVSIYFQGPAVKVLSRGFKGSLRGFGRPFSGFARKGMAEIGHVPPQEKLSQLRELGAQFYMCAPSMDHFGVKKDELIFEDVILSEYLTFLEVMKRADIRFFLQ